MGYRRTTWFRVTLGTVGVILVANTVLSVITVQGVSQVLVQEVQTRVNLDLHTAHMVYRDHQDRLVSILEAASIRRSQDGPLTEEGVQRLSPVLEVLRRQSRMDMLALVGLDGRVLFRAHNPGRAGDDLAGDPVVAAALAGRSTSRGNVVVDAKRLRVEGEALLERATIRLSPTPAAHPTNRTLLEEGLLVAAAVPLWDLQQPDQPLAYLYGADLLNRRVDLVDAIKGAVFQTDHPGQREIGTVTLFLGDVRIATNVQVPDGGSAVGTRMSGLVHDRVIREGRVWTDRAFVVSDWYITAYEPIWDVQGRVVGSLYVGLLEEPFTRPRGVIVGVFMATLVLTTLASLVLLFLVIRAMLRPFSRIVGMAERVVGGDLSARVGVRPPGEMGALCQAIDAMASAVQEREDRLRNATQAQMSEAERLASIGRLAAGVAHEVNNPLTGVLTFAHVLKARVAADAEMRQAADIIISETMRVRDTVRGLLDFARQSPTVMATLDLRDVVRHVLHLMRQQATFAKVTFQDQLGPHPARVNGDRNQLQQVFLNLCLNAVQAMPTGGTLTVSHQARPDGTSAVLIRDTGCGIRPADLSHIFEPFFTTKPVGEGTGLGLSVSYGIVTTHGGTIEVETQEGAGSTFTVVLPSVPVVTNPGEETSS
jgi:two-component system NtrC family sensor kinase